MSPTKHFSCPKTKCIDYHTTCRQAFLSCCHNAFDRQANTGCRAGKLQLIKYEMTGARVDIITHSGEAMGREFEPTPSSP